MVIKKLILKGYKRFLLSNIETLDYEPKQTIQMIASRNLAGKSSLLKQLNPLPADIKKDFKEDGYKYIEIEHLNNYYKLKSDKKHSFIVNDIELNPGGTKKVQLELVKDHFKITPNIMDILYNTVSITTMSPSERKYWFSEMSNVDYVYPVKVYNLLKQRHRDIVGFIKFTQDDIIKSELTIANKETMDKLYKDRENLEAYINHVISLYDHNVRTDNNLDILSKIEELTKEISSTLSSISSELTKKELEESISKNIGIISSCKNNIENLKKDIDKLDKIKELGTTKDIKDKIENLNKRKDILEKSVYIAITNNMYNDIWIDYSSIYGNIMEYFNNLLEYEDVRHKTREEIDKLALDYNNLNLLFRSKQNKLNLLKSELEHMLKHKTQENLITCEKCNHSWYLHYNPDKEKEYNKQIEELDKELKELENKLNDFTKVINKIKALEELSSSFKELLKSKPLLFPIWQVVFTKHNVKSCNISMVLSELNKLAIDLEQWKELDVINKELSVLETNLDNIKAIEDATKDSNKTILENMIKSLEENTAMLNATTKMLESNKIELQVKNKLEDLYVKLYNALVNYRKNLKTKEIELRNKYLLELVDTLKVELVKLETLINDNNKVISTIDKAKKTLEEYKRKEKVLGVACKILSPDEGLIAKSINSFISIIVKEMNHVINSIWTYDLEVLPCEVNEESDLDYKFKVKVNNDHIVEDVSKLSSSGKEITDLAFRLVFAKYMGLIDVPLFLDEFGNTFDQAHRQAAYNVIDKIISSTYKQIFIVCHFSSIYGSLKNVDFNVLDSNNIDLDPSIDANQVMKISRY